MTLNKLNFSDTITAALRTKLEEGKQWIFDSVRKKWLVCTRDEWVRKHAVQYHIVNGYSIQHIQLETP